MKTSALVIAAVLTGSAALSVGLARQSTPTPPTNPPADTPRPSAPTHPAAPAAPPSTAAPRATAAQAERFTVDAVHSSLIFKIRHMNVSNFYGRFNDLSGEYSLDAANPAASSFKVEVKTDSIDTANEKRDGHLKNPDFFNAAEFPTISFTSSKVSAAGAGKLRVDGELDLHGVSKPITADVTVFPAAETRQGRKSGFEATFTIKRSDFEMDTYIAEGGLGDEVTITIAVEGAKAE